MKKQLISATGRLTAMTTPSGTFTWTHHPNSNLKHTLTYTYNPRSEIITAHAQNDPAYHYDYTFDAIGNRLTSTENGTNSVYLANQLNQYTAINTFTPQFDPDGNQLLIQTATGLWHVTYNGENRPILWTQGETRIEMAYDHVGRRISYTSTTGTTVTRHTHFHYNGYLCLQEIAPPTGATLAEYTWDPTEPIATRPLQIYLPQGDHSGSYFYHLDGNKNVTDLTNASGLSAAHYEYSPFGATVTQTGPLASINPYRFSSEHHDDTLALIYYNYRHYNPANGRWFTHDPIEEKGGKNLYSLVCNGTINNTDRLGLSWIEKLKKCNKMLEDSKSAEPFAGIRLLHIEMVLSGCDPVMPVCTCCLDSDSAFYWPFPPSIFICSNNFSEFTDPLALASILYQEWVHQYQNCKGGPSVMNCSERICAEIEAQYAQYKAMYPSMYGGASDLAMKNAIRNGVKATSVGIFTCSEAEFDKLYNQLFDSCKRKNKIPLPGDTNQ